MMPTHTKMCSAEKNIQTAKIVRILSEKVQHVGNIFRRKRKKFRSNMSHMWKTHELWHKGGHISHRQPVLRQIQLIVSVGYGRDLLLLLARIALDNNAITT